MPFLVYATLLILLALPYDMDGIYYLLAIGIAAPTLVCAGALSDHENRRLASVSTFLGWISYPLYCLHYPIGQLTYLLGATGIYATAAASVTTLLLAIVVTKLYDEPVRACLMRQMNNYRYRDAAIKS